MLDPIITKPPLNPDQNVNHGCNLKWKFGEKLEDQIPTIEVWRGKIISKSKYQHQSSFAIKNKGTE